MILRSLFDCEVIIGRCHDMLRGWVLQQYLTARIGAQKHPQYMLNRLVRLGCDDRAGWHLLAYARRSRVGQTRPSTVTRPWSTAAVSHRLSLTFRVLPLVVATWPQAQGKHPVVCCHAHWWRLVQLLRHAFGNTRLVRLGGRGRGCRTAPYRKTAWNQSRFRNYRSICACISSASSVHCFANLR
jgi:hypothetical protein